MAKKNRLSGRMGYNQRLIKKYFIAVGICCLLFVVMAAMLITINTHDNEYITSATSDRPKREIKYSSHLIHSIQSDKCQALKANINKNIFVRTKRDTSIDPVDYHESIDGISMDYAREKRKAEIELKSLEQQYTRCRKYASEGKSCDDIYKKLLILANEFSEKFTEIKDLIKDLKSEDSNDVINEKMNRKMSADTNRKLLESLTIDSQSVVNSADTDNSDDRKDLKKIEENSTNNKKSSEMMISSNIGELNNHKSHENAQLQNLDAVKPLPRIHEDLMGITNNKHWRNDETKNMENFVGATSKLYHADNRDNDKNITPLKNPNFDASSQILQLCDQISRQNIHSEPPPSLPPPQVINNIPGPTSSGFVINNGQHFPNQFPHQQQQFIPHQQQQFISHQQQQFIPHQQQQQFMAPTFTYRSSPICFYPSPPMPQFSAVPNSFVPNQQFIPTNSAMMGGQNQGVDPRSRGFIFVPPNLVTTSGAQQFGTTSPSGQGFISNSRQHFPDPRNKLPPNQAYYCAFSPENQHQMGEHFRATSKNVPGDSDIIYASYANQLMAMNSSGVHNFCKAGEMSCFGTNQCIPNEKWCDSIVDCLDSSDETVCSCRSRLTKDKICDGYADCPMSSDEIGCFGCDKFSYSCYNNAEEFNNAQQSVLSMCYSIVEKCDGFENCLNGKDERDCSILAQNIGPLTSYMVSYTEGFLHRNYKGRWFPVCNEPLDWAKEACEAELGDLDSDPILRYRPSLLPGPFISNVASNQFDSIDQHSFSDTCPPSISNQKSVILYVNCPKAKCGTVKKQEPKSPLRIRNDDFERKRRDEILGVVGGFRSEPQTWPYIIALYKNGHFHCGGIIHTEFWIISAAHCVSDAERNYYEVRAGMLRRFSYASTTQIVKVANIIVNDGYSHKDMKNDLSLLKLETPLLYNRWVKPICLPSPEKVTFADDPRWVSGPRAGTLCTAVGWGALREQGPDPDNLREVNVPIMESCIHPKDIEGNELCAGIPTGGRDACQGDSGGPLFCHSAANFSEIYLAGIVSHGEGCARPNEPGVYTRVALFVDWIFKMENSDLMVTSKFPQLHCPGFRCVWDGRCIPYEMKCDGVVDCLGGEDEVQCSFFPNREIFLTEEIELTTANPTLNDNEKIENKTDLPAENSKSDLQSTTPSAKIIEETTIIPSENNKPKLDHSTVAPTDSSKSDSPPSFNGPQMPIEPEITNNSDDNTKSDTSPSQGTTEPTTIITSTPGLPLPNESTDIRPSIDTDDQSKAETETIKPEHIKEIPSDASPIDSTKTDNAEILPNELADNTNSHKNDSEKRDLPIETDDKKIDVTPNNSADQTVVIPSDINSKSDIAPPKPIVNTRTTTILPPTPAPAPILPIDQKHKLDKIEKDEKHKKVEIIEVQPAHNNGKEQNLHDLIENLDKFKCTKIGQTINVNLRCDGSRDCEDGTDEDNCTCRDSITHKYSHLICNGQVDCIDLTDEKDCLTCTQDEYECRLSKKCVPKQTRCNENFDCDLKEDELDCIALTDGNKVLIDVNLRPNLNHKGIVSKNTNGVWNVMCVKKLEINQNGAEMAGQICSILGFSGYRFYNVTPVQHEEIKLPREADDLQVEEPHFSKHLHTHYDQNPRYLFKRHKDSNDFWNDIHADMQDGSHFSEMVATPKKCFGFYIECVPHALTPIIIPNLDVKPIVVKHKEKPVKPIKPIVQPDKIPVVIVTPPADEKEPIIIEDLTTEHFPWSASIYINGELACNGVLLDRFWVIVEGSCVNTISWHNDYITVVLGISKNSLKIKGPYEQIIRVDCMRALNGNGLLLHLFTPVQFNRHCLPAYLPQITKTNNLECLAVSHNRPGGLQSIPIIKSDKECLELNKCFRSTIEDQQWKDIQCKGFNASKYGVILCKSEKSSYYPLALYVQANGLCSFNSILPLPTLEQAYSDIQKIIDWPYCDYSAHPAICSGHRCLLGNCLPSDRVCNGKTDCHDGSDEDDSVCNKRAQCSLADIKCKNGKCVSKTKFCDRINDCEDWSDEPEQCNCLEYLKATDPAKICDGIPNCSDKSDEKALECKCRAESFQCGSSIFCVPHEYVCDQQRDCPRGEDEVNCFGLEQPTAANDGYALVVQRSSGVWHTKCIEKPNVPSFNEILAICEKLGYKNVTKADARVIDSNQSSARYSQSPTKTVILNPFSVLSVNAQFSVNSFKPSREPFAKVAQWNGADDDSCYKLEINCNQN